MKDVPCLNFEDRIISKLIANADRWCDLCLARRSHAEETSAGFERKISRDLIDLCIVADELPIPQRAILKANDIYSDAEKCLIEAVKQFQNLTALRQKCYDTLQISNSYKIVNGLDRIAQSYSLPMTQRSFGEIDFGYLDEAPLPLQNDKDQLEP